MALALLLTSAAMQAHIRWESTSLNLGTFHEENGPKSGELRFLNEGPDTTFIRRVRPACGCTTAGFYEGSIAPGEYGTVTIAYDPAGRPGRFEKTVKVYTGNENTLTTLRLYGTVIGTSESLKDRFPEVGGPMRFSAANLDAGRLTHGQKKYLYLTAYNTANETLRPTVQNIHGPLDVIVTSLEAPAGDLMSFSVMYDSRLEKEMGAKTYSFDIVPSLNAEPFTVTVTANVEPDTSGMTLDDIVNAPQIYLPHEMIDLGTVKAGKNAKTTIDIINRGKSPLHVTRIYSSNPAVKIKAIPIAIKSGGKGSASLVIDTDALGEGPYRLEVSIATDDVLHPVVSVFLSLLVQER